MGSNLYLLIFDSLKGYNSKLVKNKDSTPIPESVGRDPLITLLNSDLFDHCYYLPAVGRRGWRAWQSRNSRQVFKRSKSKTQDTTRISNGYLGPTQANRQPGVVDPMT